MDDLRLSPSTRITPTRVRAFIEQISTEVRPTSVAIYIDDLHYAARLIAPRDDWRWLGAIRSRLAARAKPLDRFNQLIPARQTLDLGIVLMDEAITLGTGQLHAREIQYRDGLLLALLSLWPIRRRSITALTVSGHVEMEEDGVTLLLYPENAKSKRAEYFRLPEMLVPYMECYLTEMRPNFPGAAHHDGLWASNKGRPLCEGRVYDIVRHHTGARFGKMMGLHDFRRVP